MRGLALVVLLVGCGSRPAPRYVAVGTYVGGGSVLSGPSSCTYQGDAAVFALDKADATGPRFVAAAGAFTETCGDSTTTYTAVEPTSAMIDGPDKLAPNSQSPSLRAALFTGGEKIDGDASIEWALGPDCAGHATFAPVLGAQDTGGKDRDRKLVTTSAGTCTVTATLTTGSTLYQSFAPKVFTAEKRITIQ